jgi:hypothetical protein
VSIPPGQSNEPVNPWATAPAGPAVPYPAPPGYPPYPFPEPPRRSNRAALLIVAGLGVLALALSAAVFFTVRKDGTAAAPASSSAPVTTTTSSAKPKPFAEIGDCVLMTGGSFNPSYKKVPCAENQHNYTVSKVPETSSEQCGATAEGYIKYTKGSRTTVCLVPVFADGECYDFALASLNAEFPKKECGGYMVVRAKVITGTADKAACVDDGRLAAALAYPEIKTTYCLTHTFTVG